MKILGSIFILGALISGNPCSAQDDVKRYEAIFDSLQYITDTSSGTRKVDAILQFYKIHHESGVRSYRGEIPEMLNDALALSEELGYLKGQMLIQLSIVSNLISGGIYSKGLAHLKIAIPLIDEVEGLDHALYHSASKNLLARIYQGQGQLDSALYYMQGSIKEIDSSIHCNTLSVAYMYLAYLYSVMGDQERELNSFHDAYDQALKCSEGSYDLGIAAIASRLGYALMTRGVYREARDYFLIADSIYSAANLIYPRHKSYHAIQASNLSRVYQHWGLLDSAMKYRQIALQRFDEYGFSETNINVPNQYCYIGTIYREWGERAAATVYLQKSLELRKINGDSLGVGMSLDELAELSRMQGKYLEAVDLLNEAMIWKRNLKDARIDPSRKAQQTESQSETYLLLGKVFADWHKYIDALMYYDTSMMLARRVSYKRGEAIIEYYRGMVFQQSGQADSALWYFQRSLDLAEMMQNQPLIAKARSGLGKLYSEEGLYGNARNEFENALEIYLEDGFSRELPVIYLELGYVFSKKDDYSEALDAFLEAYDRADRMGMISIQSTAARELATLYEESGRTSLSNHYLKKYILLHDSVFTLETHRQLAEMQAFHESQQQQLQIMQLQQSNELNSLRANRNQNITISLGGIVIIILLFAILFFRQIRIRNEQKALLNQQQLFRSQMNPHFIFNSLTNIQHYIFSKDSMAAGKYLAIFAKLMRSILDNSRREIISLKEEIATISQYLALQQLRMEEKLDYEINVDEGIDPELTEIPPMLAQPFIENAIEHGIRNKEDRGKVMVRIRKENGYLLYEVEDDGVGRTKAAELQTDKQKDHESTAVSLTRSRLQSLWGRKKPGKVFEILDLIDEDGKPSGTLVRFKVPCS